MYEHIPQTLVFICQHNSGTWLFLVRNNPHNNLQRDRFCRVYFIQNTWTNENLLKQMEDAI